MTMADLRWLLAGGVSIADLVGASVGTDVVVLSNRVALARTIADASIAAAFARFLGGCVRTMVIAGM